VGEGVTASFEGWLRAVIDHPVADPEWYWQTGFDEQWDGLAMTPALTASYLTRLLRTPEVLTPYSLDQVAQAIWFLVGEASPGDVTDSLLDPSVAIESRLECIHAIGHFFSHFVAVVAPGSADTEENAFHTACFMWWDIFPIWRDQRTEPIIARACLDVMRRSLELPSDLCQLSALHGLNHWYRHYRLEADSIVDAFLRGGTLSPKVREYAGIARVGGSQ
jgi:hypothetical protein